MHMGAESFRDLKTILAVSIQLMIDQPSHLMSGCEGVSYRLFVAILAAMVCNLCISSRVVVPQHPHTGIKVVPYTFVRRRVPVREDTYPEPSACEVRWPVPFLAAFISPVLPPGTHLLLGEQLASIQSGHQVGLEP